MPTWPKDTMKDKIAFYGDPRGPHGSNPLWEQKNLVLVKPPFKMTYAGKPISGIRFHRKCADALTKALDGIWIACNKKQSEVDKYGLSIFGGSFNYRLIRGSSNLSNHSFGIAVDINPNANGLYAKGNMPKFAVEAFKKQGARWGGDYKSRKDPMHFEFVS